MGVPRLGAFTVVYSILNPAAVTVVSVENVITSLFPSVTKESGDFTPQSRADNLGLPSVLKSVY